MADSVRSAAPSPIFGSQRSVSFRAIPRGKVHTTVPFTVRCVRAPSIPSTSSSRSSSGKTTSITAPGSGGSEKLALPLRPRNFGFTTALSWSRPEISPGSINTIPFGPVCPRSFASQNEATGAALPSMVASVTARPSIGMASTTQSLP